MSRCIDGHVNVRTENVDMRICVVTCECDRCMFTGRLVKSETAAHGVVVCLFREENAVSLLDCTQPAGLAWRRASQTDVTMGRVSGLGVGDGGFDDCEEGNMT